MVITTGLPLGGRIMASNDNEFNSDDLKWSERPARLQHRFLVLRKLGQGTYGKVQLALNKETNQEVAIKTIKKARIENEEDMLRIRREIHIMNSIRHPHIIHINEVFETRQKIVLVMQYASGGELYDYLGCHHTLPEEEARRLFRQIASAIYYCHKNKICHRDLKLENILLDEEGNAQIADFGLSNIFDDRRRMNTFCGSPLYASPEIVKGTPYKGPEVDCWSLGVLLYTLIYGTMPFDGRNFKELVSQISEGRYEEPINKSSASALIRRLLTPEISRRATIFDVCIDNWVNQGYNESLVKIAEKMTSEALLKTRKLGPPKIISESFSMNETEKKIPRTTLVDMEQRNKEKQPNVVNGNTDNFNSVISHESEKVSLYEQILNYDVSFVINKLLIAVESAITCPMLEVNNKRALTAPNENILPTFKPWSKHGESCLGKKVESAYVIPIFEVTSVMPKVILKNTRNQNKGENSQLCFTQNTTVGELRPKNSELYSKTEMNSNLNTKKKSFPNQTHPLSSKQISMQNSVESPKQETDLAKQIILNNDASAIKIHESSALTSETCEPKGPLKARSLMTQENILPRTPSVKMKKAHENHLFGQRQFGPFFRSKNHSLTLAHIFSMRYEKLVLDTLKKPERKQKPPGKITIPATFDPSISQNEFQERKEIVLLFPTVSVSENKEKIEKKIDKIKKAALNMNLIRRSNTQNRLKIQKYLKSQAKKMQDLVCDEHRSIVGSMDHINGIDGFSSVSEPYFCKFEKGNLNPFNIKLHNKKINFINSNLNHSINPFAYGISHGEEWKLSGSENILIEQKQNLGLFGIAKSKSDIQFPNNYASYKMSNASYRSSISSGYNSLSNTLSIPNSDCSLLRSASDSEGLNFFKNTTNSYANKDNLKCFEADITDFYSKDEKLIFNKSFSYNESETVHKTLEGETNQHTRHSSHSSDLRENVKNNIIKPCKDNFISFNSTNDRNKTKITIRRSNSTSFFTGSQNISANDLQNIKRLLLTPLRRNENCNKINNEQKDYQKSEMIAMDKPKPFPWNTITLVEDECGMTGGNKNHLRRRNSLSCIADFNNEKVNSSLGNALVKSAESGTGMDDYLWTTHSKQTLLVHQKDDKFSSFPNLCHLPLGKKNNFKMSNDNRSINSLNARSNIINENFDGVSLSSMQLSVQKPSEKSALLRRILQESDNDDTFCDFPIRRTNRAKSISEDALIQYEDDVLHSTQSERKLSLPQGIGGKSPFLSKFLNDLEKREQLSNTIDGSLNQRHYPRKTFTSGKRSKLEKRSKSFLQLLSLKRIQEAEKELEKAERSNRTEAEEDSSGSLLEALKTHGYKGVISQRFQGTENDAVGSFNLRSPSSPFLTRKISPDISHFNSVYYDTLSPISPSYYEDNDLDLDMLNGLTMRSLYEIYPGYTQNSPKQFIYDWLQTNQNCEYSTPFKTDPDSNSEPERPNHTKEMENLSHWGKDSPRSFDEASSSESFETPKDQYTNGTINNELGKTRDHPIDNDDFSNCAKADRNPLLRTSSASEDEREESVQDRIWRKSFYSRFNNSALSRKERSAFMDPPLSESRAGFRENCLTPFKVTLRDGMDYVNRNGYKDPQSKRIHTARKYSSSSDTTVSSEKTKLSKSTKYIPVERTETSTTLTTEMDETEPEH